MTGAKVVSRRSSIGLTTNVNEKIKPGLLRKMNIQKHNNMNKQSQPMNNVADQLADKARVLTAAVTGEDTAATHPRLAATRERVKKLADRVRSRAADRAKATDLAVRHHPYRSIGLGIGLGSVIGYLAARRHYRA
jgi:ElaB/YqjD/DUF883 family membrane-anchored ribosome-binding protein